MDEGWACCSKLQLPGIPTELHKGSCAPFWMCMSVCTCTCGLTLCLRVYMWGACVNVYAYAYMYACEFVCVCIGECALVLIHSVMCASMRARVCVCTCPRVGALVCANTYKYVHEQICVHTHMCILGEGASHWSSPPPANASGKLVCRSKTHNS